MPTRSYRVSVARRQQLSSTLTRITLTGDGLKHFATDGLDQRVKIVFPLARTGFGNYGLLDEPPVPLMEWYARWRLLAEAERNPLRTYTSRNPRPELREVDIDFVLHGDSGPATAWAAKAQTGDEVVLVGPDSRSRERVGIEWNPGAGNRVLLAGDETALPAISAILESLPENIDGHAFIEVPHSDDALGATTRSRVKQTWLPRNGTPLGRLLESAVREWTAHNLVGHPGREPEQINLEDEILWEIPDSPAHHADNPGFYAWLAGEAGMITSLRRHLVKDVGIDRRQVAFMGYWRRGRAES